MRRNAYKRVKRHSAPVYRITNEILDDTRVYLYVIGRLRGLLNRPVLLRISAKAFINFTKNKEPSSFNSISLLSSTRHQIPAGNNGSCDRKWRSSSNLSKLFKLSKVLITRLIQKRILVNFCF